MPFKFTACAYACRDAIHLYNLSVGAAIRCRCGVHSYCNTCSLQVTYNVYLLIHSQFDYPEGPVPLRFLRLKHTNVRQNITYNCDSGVDSFMLVKMLGANGETLTFGDKTVRMVSQVSQSLLHDSLHCEGK